MAPGAGPYSWVSAGRQAQAIKTATRQGLAKPERECPKKGSNQGRVPWREQDDDSTRPSFGRRWSGW